MGKQTTPFQAIIKMVREQTAQPGVTVTESKMLADPRPGMPDREVDVVIEGEFDGDPVVTSIEVIEHGRRADVTWAEQLIAKHRFLATNRLILVSQSGFSTSILALVTSEGGWVEAVQPVIKEEDGEAVVEEVFVELIEASPKNYRVIMQQTAGEAWVDVKDDISVFDRGGVEIGSVFRLGNEIINLPWVMKKFMVDAHHHPERDALKAFSSGFPMTDLEYFLRFDATGELHQIIYIEVGGDFKVTQSPMPFTATSLGNREYGTGQGDLFGQEGVWVKTTNPSTQKTTISWRSTEKKTAEEKKEVPRMYFPGLLTLKGLDDGLDPETGALRQAEDAPQT